MFAGGGEELDWTLSVLFDAMGAMSSQFNDTPEKASRAYDKNRDGFVIAGGGGILVLEELEHAKARGAKIYAELAGYGATVGRRRHGGAVGRRRGALHAPWRSTTVKAPDRLHQRARHLDAGRRHSGDQRHARSLRREDAADQFHQIADRPQPGAAGVHEAIYSLLQMQNGFIAESANIEELDPEVADAHDRAQADRQREASTP